MSILGVIVRTRPERCAGVEQRLGALPGVEVAEREGLPDGRVVIVVEDHDDTPAAATLAAVALWPEVLNTSLVWEYSGPDSPAPEALAGYDDWRRSVAGGGRRS